MRKPALCRPQGGGALIHFEYLLKLTQVLANLGDQILADQKLPAESEVLIEKKTKVPELADSTVNSEIEIK